MFNKRAQAAMEFLMTYGWAILVVLVAIGALAYFGVLSPDQFLPERCTGPAGLDCLDKAAISTGGTVSFVLKNNQGYRINVTGSSSGTGDCLAMTALTDGSGTTISDTAGDYVIVANNQQITLTATCAASLPTGRFKGSVIVPYTNIQTGLNHSASVSVTGAAT